MFVGVQPSLWDSWVPNAKPNAEALAILEHPCGMRPKILVASGEDALPLVTAACVDLV